MFEGSAAAPRPGVRRPLLLVDSACAFDYHTADECCRAVCHYAFMTSKTCAPKRGVKACAAERCSGAVLLLLGFSSICSRASGPLQARRQATTAAGGQRLCDRQLALNLASNTDAATNEHEVIWTSPSVSCEGETPPLLLVDRACAIASSRSTWQVVHTSAENVQNMSNKR